MIRRIAQIAGLARFSSKRNMKENTVRFRELLSPSASVTSTTAAVVLTILVLAMNCIAQSANDAQAERVVSEFLTEWLVNRNVDKALSYLSDQPVFPSCTSSRIQMNVRGSAKA